MKRPGAERGRAACASTRATTETVWALGVGAIATLFEALEDLAARLEGGAGRLADWAHGRHCDTCRREQA